MGKDTARCVQVVALGWERSDPNRILQFFVREHYRIHYVTRGCGYLVTEKYTYRLTAGTGFVIFPGQTARYNPDKDDPWEYFWLGVEGAAMDALCGEKGIAYNHSVFKVADKKQQLRKSLIQMYVASITPEKTGEFYRYLGQFFSHITPIHKSHYRQSRCFEKSLRYIHENYMNEISILHLASELAIDRTYLYKLFKQNLGTSPQDYLIAHRISKACDLLISTDLRVTDIASQVGFGDLSDFGKQFKKRMELSATEFRELRQDKKSAQGDVLF